MTTMLNDLIVGSEYKFRVKAESPYGLSDPSDETDVIFIPDPKRGILSAPPRSRSQPRDGGREDLPVPPKRRSASSTRNQSRENSGIVIPDTIPVRPKRDKIKSPPLSPNQSPVPTRKDAGINTNMFDRASMARELAYGFDVRAKRTEVKPQSPNQLEVKPGSRSPSPNSRTKSPSRLNTILASILPNKKSPSPTKKSSSPKEETIPKQTIQQVVSPSVDIPMTVQMLEVRSERSDLFDRSPSPMERRLSLKMNGSPEKGNKSPSPSKKSPSPSRLSIHSNEGSRRESIRSNRQNSLDNDEQGSSEFMLVLFPESGDKYYPGIENYLWFFYLAKLMIQGGPLS